LTYAAQQENESFSFTTCIRAMPGNIFLHLQFCGQPLLHVNLTFSAVYCGLMKQILHGIQ
jgi:hypothetical protein